MSELPYALSGDTLADLRADIDTLRRDMATLRHMHSIVLSRVRILEAAEASRGGRVPRGSPKDLGEYGG
ncbi:hypothetical protein [Acidisphaera sp. L21]|uniref:hypothetical protein n=1 Tax=Acidisphaera sp. L21 TaxID=1641851 RepID=UPI00131BCEB0|nr:hypothetical protein [Acidisphaera sp. L21]